MQVVPCRKHLPSPIGALQLPAMAAFADRVVSLAGFCSLASSAPRLLWQDLNRIHLGWVVVAAEWRADPHTVIEARRCHCIDIDRDTCLVWRPVEHANWDHLVILFADTIACCGDVSITVEDAVVPGENRVPRTAGAITDFDDHPIQHNVARWIFIFIVDQVVACVWRATYYDVRA